MGTVLEISILSWGDGQKMLNIPLHRGTSRSLYKGRKAKSTRPHSRVSTQGQRAESPHSGITAEFPKRSPQPSLAHRLSQPSLHTGPHIRVSSHKSPQQTAHTSPQLSLSTHVLTAESPQRRLHTQSLEVAGRRRCAPPGVSRCFRRLWVVRALLSSLG